MESESALVVNFSMKKAMKRKRKGERAKFTRKKKHKKVESEPEVEIKVEPDIKLEPESEENFEEGHENSDPILEDKEAVRTEIKQEMPECPLIKSEPIDEDDPLSYLDVADDLDASNEPNSDFECNEANCRKCKEQQVAYCFLSFHECWYEDTRCIVCCDLSQLMVGEHSHHCKDTTLKCVFCGRIFDDLLELREHDCETIISKEYKCSMCPAKSTKIGAYFKHILFTHCGVNRLQCQQCLARFHDPRTLARHIRSNHTTPPKDKKIRKKKSSKKATNDDDIIREEEEDKQAEEPDDSTKTEVKPLESLEIESKAEEEKECLVDEKVSSPSKEDTNAESKNMDTLPLCDRATCTKCYDRAGTLCLRDFHNCPVTNDGEFEECQVCLQMAYHFKLEKKEISVQHIGCSTIRCAFCIRNFPDTAALKAHDCDSLSDNKCRHCGVVAKTFLKLCVHLFYHFKIVAFKCGICSKNFVAMQRYESHLRDHSVTPKFKCLECGLAFHKMREYKNHKSKHGDEKPHKCEKCPKRFNAGYQLVLHMETHADKKPYPCTKCERSFVKPRNLEHHEYTFHGTGALQCKLCNRKLSCPIRYRNHMKYHDNGTRYSCSDCGRAYASKSTLNRHVRIHTTEVIRCDVEGCTYNTHYDWLLRAHKISHSGVKPQLCQKCPRGFYTKRSLVKHVAKWHTEGEGTEKSNAKTTDSKPHLENGSKEGETTEAPSSTKTKIVLTSPADKNKLKRGTVSATTDSKTPPGRRSSMEKAAFATTRHLVRFAFENEAAVRGGKSEVESESSERGPQSNDSAKVMADFAKRIASLQDSLAANGIPVEFVPKNKNNSRLVRSKSVQQARVVSTESGVIWSNPKIVYPIKKLGSNVPEGVRRTKLSKFTIPNGSFPLQAVMKVRSPPRKAVAASVRVIPSSKLVPISSNPDFEQSIPFTELAVTRTQALSDSEDDVFEQETSSTESTAEFASEKPESWNTISFNQLAPSPKPVVTFPLRIAPRSDVAAIRGSSKTASTKTVVISPLMMSPEFSKTHPTSTKANLTIWPGKTFSVPSKITLGFSSEAVERTKAFPTTPATSSPGSSGMYESSAAKTILTSPRLVTNVSDHPSTSTKDEKTLKETPASEPRLIESKVSSVRAPPERKFMPSILRRRVGK